MVFVFKMSPLENVYVLLTEKHNCYFILSVLYKIGLISVNMFVVNTNNLKIQNELKKGTLQTSF